MFVRRSNVRRRRLTKLEELRLRRELSEANSGVPPAGAGRGGTTTATATAAATTRARAIRSPPTSGSSIASGTTTPGKDAAAAGVGGAGGTSNKLEELRAKREALARERGGAGGNAVVAREGPGTPGANAAVARGTISDGGGGRVGSEPDDDGRRERETAEEEGVGVGVGEETTAAASAAPAINLASATPGYRAELTRLQSKITGLETDLRKKNAECASLQSSLDFMSKGAEQSTHDAVRMYAMVSSEYRSVLFKLLLVTPIT